MSELNPPYEGFIVESMPLGGWLTGKYYAVDIRGRADRSREWKGQDFQQAKQDLEKVLEMQPDIQCIPRIVIAMPHVSRVYSFGNPFDSAQRETNMHAELYATATCQRLPLHEIGCDGEIAILGEERKFWNESATVEEYLSKFVPNGSLGVVQNPNKLRTYLERIK